MRSLSPSRADYRVIASPSPRSPLPACQTGPARLGLPGREPAAWSRPAGVGTEGAAVSWTEQLPTQRRLWGLPPQAVADWAAAREREHEREVADLRARVADLERRQAQAQADLAARDRDLARVAARLDEAAERAGSLETAVERARRGEEERARHDRVLREEAVRVVADAWTEAQAIRERARRLAERTQARLRAEIERARGMIQRDRDQWEGEIAALRARRALAVADLEATARDLLAQAARFKEEGPAEEQTAEGAAPETPQPAAAPAAQFATAPQQSAEAPEAAATTPEAATTRAAQAAPPPPPSEVPAAQVAAASPPSDATPQAAATPPPAQPATPRPSAPTPRSLATPQQNGTDAAGYAEPPGEAPPADVHLRHALDDLEALLDRGRAPRAPGERG